MQFNADKCPSNSVVGKTSTSVLAGGLISQTVPGTIYFLEPRTTDTATIGMIMRPSRICILFIFCATPSKMFLKTEVSLQTYGDSGNLRTATTGTPSTSTASIPLLVTSGSLTLDITVNRLVLTFNGRANATNSGPYAMVATTSCLPAVARATITSYQSVSSPQTATYTPTGCPSVPFNPGMDATFSSTASNSTSATSVKITVPQADAAIQNAHPKIIDIDFPVGSGIELANMEAVNGCTEAQLKVDTCPADSVIGAASSVAPYLPPQLTGTVYAMGPITNAVPVGVVLRGARGTRIIFRGTLGIRGDVENNQGRAYARFDAIPQLPYADVVVTVQRPIYKNPRKPAYDCGLQTVTGNITGFNGTAATIGYGTTVTRSQQYQLTGCDAEPDTTITSGPAQPSSTDNTPNFTFT